MQRKCHILFEWPLTHLTIYIWYYIFDITYHTFDITYHTFDIIHLPLHIWHPFLAIIDIFRSWNYQQYEDPDEKLEENHREDYQLEGFEYEADNLILAVTEHQHLKSLHRLIINLYVQLYLLCTSYHFFGFTKHLECSVFQPGFRGT